AELTGQIQAVVVQVCNDYVPGSGEFCNGGGQNADGTGAGYQHVFSQKVEGQGGVGCVAEGIEDGVQLLRNFRGTRDDVGGGNHQIFGKSAVPVHAYAAGGSAQMSPAGAAVAAHAADDVPFPGDQLAQMVALYVGAHLHNFPDVFVAGGGAQSNGVLSPFVPVPDVHVRTTDGGFVNFN